MSDFWYILRNIVIIILAWFGAFYILELVGREISEIPSNFTITCVKVILSGFISILIGTPMWGFIKSKLRIYGMIMLLSKNFHNSENVTWKIMLRLLIQRLIGRVDTNIKTTFANYISACIAGAKFAKQEWFSTFVAPDKLGVQLWRDLHLFMEPYMSEVKKIHGNKTRFIISSEHDLRTSIQHIQNKQIFLDSSCAGATTYVVFNDSDEVKERNFLDFCMFDDIIIITGKIIMKNLMKLRNKLDNREITYEKYIEEINKCEIVVSFIIKPFGEGSFQKFTIYKTEKDDLLNLTCRAKQRVVVSNGNIDFCENS